MLKSHTCAHAHIYGYLCRGVQVSMMGMCDVACLPTADQSKPKDPASHESSMSKSMSSSRTGPHLNHPTWLTVGAQCLQVNSGAGDGGETGH